MSSQSKQAFKVHVNSCLENVMKKNSWYIAHSDETLMEDGFQPIMDPVNWNFFLFNFGNFFWLSEWCMDVDEKNQAYWGGLYLRVEWEQNGDVHLFYFMFFSQEKPFQDIMPCPDYGSLLFPPI